MKSNTSSRSKKDIKERSNRSASRESNKSSERVKKAKTQKVVRDSPISERSDESETYDDLKNHKVAELK
jgi:hypothetical protein